MAKTTALSFIGTASENYIQQITALEGTFDIAPYHKIVFYNGAAAVDGIVWNGTQDLEVVIPTIADLVKDPVKFAGTVDASDGTISWTTVGHSAQKGDLVYMTVDCTFNTIACEAGDMAIYDGTSWHVVTGENQVTINAGDTVSGNDNLFSITGTAKTLLTVEGKTLSVAIDYADVRSKIAVSLNDELSRNLQSGNVTLNSTKLAVSEVAGTPSDITTSVAFSLPYALADGTVTIGQSVLTSGDFTFTSGSFPTVVKNEAVEATVSHNLSIGKSSSEDSTAGDYVTSVDAIKAVSFTTATSDGEHDFAYVVNVSASGTKSFVSGIHVYDSTVDDSTKADFTVYGAVTAASANNTFATGWDAEASTGEVVSSITVGNVTIGASSANNVLVTGLSDGGSTVITGVTFGSISFTGSSDFVTGLGSTEASTGDVVTSVNFGTTSLTEDSTVTAKAAAIVSATVSNHVLSFTTADFMKPVRVDVTGQSVSKKEFVKGSVSLTGFSFTSDALTFGGISQADTTISYKSLLTGEVTLTQDSTLYYLDKASQDQYVAEMSYANWSYTAATVSKNTPVLENTSNMKATIPANTFAVALSTDGVLPSLTVGTPTGALTASVGTALSTSEFSFLGVDPDKKNITIPSYTLVSGAESGIDVALAGDYAVTGTITIPSNQYVKDVLVDGTSVIPTVEPQP